MVAMMIGGVWQDADKARNPAKPNFVIVCNSGDWSGFLTLGGAKAREQSLASLKRPDGYFWIEER